MNDKLQNLEAIEELCRNLRASVEGAANNEASEFFAFHLIVMQGDFTFV